MNIVIVGSGVAGVTAAEALAKSGHAVTLVTREAAGYYSRPLLSHGFSRDNIEQQIITRGFEAIRQQNLVIHTECDARRIDRTAQKLHCSGAQGEFALDYDALILATGSDAFIPPPLLAFSAHFHVLNSLADLLKLRQLRQQVLDKGQKPNWAMIGGGLIGCEVASDLALAGDSVTLFHAVDRLMERQLDESDSARLLQTFIQTGIAVELNCNVASISADGETRTIQTGTKRHEGFHCVIVACGFKPRTGLASEAGLEVGRGIRVDGQLRSADPHIYAIGDTAECKDGRLYAFILPIRGQAAWLAKHLSGEAGEEWQPPVFKPKAKIHGFSAGHD